MNSYQLDSFILKGISDIIPSFTKSLQGQNPLFGKGILVRILYFIIESQLESFISIGFPSQNPLFNKKSQLESFMLMRFSARIHYLESYSQLSSSMYRRESQLEYSLWIGRFTHDKSWMICLSSESLHSSGHTSLNYLVTCLVLESMILLKQRITARIPRRG